MHDPFPPSCGRYCRAVCPSLLLISPVGCALSLPILCCGALLAIVASASNHNDLRHACRSGRLCWSCGCSCIGKASGLTRSGGVCDGRQGCVRWPQGTHLQHRAADQRMKGCLSGASLDNGRATFAPDAWPISGHIRPRSRRLRRFWATPVPN